MVVKRGVGAVRVVLEHELPAVIVSEKMTGALGMRFERVPVMVREYEATGVDEVHLM